MRTSIIAIAIASLLLASVSISAEDFSLKPIKSHIIETYEAQNDAIADKEFNDSIPHSTKTITFHAPQVAQTPAPLISDEETQKMIAEAAKYQENLKNKRANAKPTNEAMQTIATTD